MIESFINLETGREKEKERKRPHFSAKTLSIT